MTPEDLHTLPELNDAPMALTTAGTLVVNVAHLLPADDVHEMVELALTMGRPLFVGVVLHEAEVQEALGRIDDAGAEILATVVRF